MEPRYTPAWSPGDERFLGHAGEIDVYYEYNNDDEVDNVYIVGPAHRKLREETTYNFDPYAIEGGSILVLQDEGMKDIHIELSEMCEIYQLLQKEEIL